MKKRVLVTGGLGFVGSSVCRALALKNIELYVLDNESKGRLDFIEGLEFQFTKADVRDRVKVAEIFEKIQPNIVVHMAAMHFIPDCNQDPAACLDVNVVGTENILFACNNAQIERVVVTSSMAVYPIKEDANCETDIIHPYDVYGESKMANEFQAERFSLKTKITAVAVRLSNVYGPRETNLHIIPEIMNQIKIGKPEIHLGNIEPKRDFIHTSDVGSAFAGLALEPIVPGFHIVNLGSAKEYSIREVISFISIILDKAVIALEDHAKFRDVERMHLLADISKIKELIPWTPKTTIEQGLRDLCHWYGLL